MKSRARLILFTLPASAPILLIVAQQHFTPQIGESKFPITTDDQPTERAVGTLAVDRETWNIVDLRDPSAELAAYNTDELRWLRYKITLSFEYPEEFAKQYPPTAEQAALEEKAAESIKSPMSPQEISDSLTSEERASWEHSLDVILANPRAASR